MTLSLVLMVYDHHQHQHLHAVRETLSIVVSPLHKFVNGTGNAWNAVRQYCVTQQQLLNENQVLKETEFLQQGRLQKLMALEAENTQLRALLQSSARLGDDLLIAEIVNVDGDPYSHQVYLNKGKQEGIYVGQPVLDAEGVIGEVIEVFEKTSRVILLTDPSHGIPVEDVRNGVRGIAMGTGTLKTLDLHYVPNTVDIQVGDLLITSGLGGRYPAGYPVGVISQINRDSADSFATVQIKPSARLDRTRMVLLIKPQSET
jgi:rod shape-determining protein MreC